MIQTTNLDLMAGIAVSDYAAARAWYEQLLGFPPAFIPNDWEALWALAEYRYVYMHLPEHAGHARLMIVADDPDVVVAQIAARGFHPVARATHSDGHVPRSRWERECVRRRSAVAGSSSQARYTDTGNRQSPESRKEI